MAKRSPSCYVPPRTPLALQYEIPTTDTDLIVCRNRVDPCPFCSGAGSPTTLSLDQWFSFGAGLLVLFANTAWLSCVLKYTNDTR